MNGTGLSGRIALVTGGNRGLGKDVALRLSGYGSGVIITYRSHQDEALAVVAQIAQTNRKAAAIQLDISQINRLDDFCGQVLRKLRDVWGKEKLDFLINNAGFGGRAPIGQTPEALFDNLCNVHFKGVYFLTEKILPLISDNGRIVNYSSGLTRFTVPGLAAYASMKGAVEVFTKYLAKELGPRGIAANLVAPGAIDNDFNKANFDAHPEIKDFLASQTALGRLGVSEDIGGIVAFLCSEDGRWVNGQRIEASGGMFL